MDLTRRSLLTRGAAFLVLPSMARATGEMWQIEGPAFGARWRVRIGTSADARAVAQTITSVVAKVNAAMSPFVATSEISRVNAAASSDWMTLSPEFYATLTEAKRVGALTGGAFDPTLGGIVGRYGFGPISGEPAGTLEGLTLAGGAVRKADPYQTLDLCGVAKGHALDLCAAALTNAGLTSFLIEMGGEITAAGNRPDGSLWSAGIENPISASAKPVCRVAIKGEALATSGDRINSYDYGGRRYCHIIDPQSQHPAASALASVSVLAPRGSSADALATALFAMGPEEGATFAQDNVITALFLAREGTGLRQVATGGFEDRILED